MRTVALVLAAGESRRMGRPKLPLPWGDGTVLSQVVETLLRTPVDRVVVVLGHCATEVMRALAALEPSPRLETVCNERYLEGMLTSIQCGARHAGPAQLLVALGDQPLITPGVVECLLSGSETGLRVPVYDGRRGHPVRVPHDLVPELLALPAEVGMRALFLAHPDRVEAVAVDCAGVLVDLDTPADYLQHRPSDSTQPLAAG